MQPCCQEPSNLVVTATTATAKTVETIRVCAKCGRRHFECLVHPMRMGLKEVTK